MFKLQIETDNAAFGDFRAVEVARILRQLADNLSTSGDSGNLRDINGNTVGTWTLS